MSKCFCGISSFIHDRIQLAKCRCFFAISMSATPAVNVDVSHKKDSYAHESPRAYYCIPYIPYSGTRYASSDGFSRSQLSPPTQGRLE